MRGPFKNLPLSQLEEFLITGTSDAQSSLDWPGLLALPYLRRFYVRHVNGALDHWYSTISSNVIGIQLRNCVIFPRQLSPVISWCKGLKYFHHELISGDDDGPGRTIEKIDDIHGVLLEHMRDTLSELCLQYRWSATWNESLDLVSPLHFDAFYNLTWLKISAILFLGDESDISGVGDEEEATTAELTRLYDGLPPKLVRLHISECAWVLEEPYSRWLLESVVQCAQLPGFEELAMLVAVPSDVYQEHKRLPEKWKKAADSIASAADERGFEFALHIWLGDSHKRKRDRRGWGMYEDIRWKYDAGPRAPAALYYWNPEEETLVNVEYSDQEEVSEDEVSWDVQNCRVCEFIYMGSEDVDEDGDGD